MSRTNEADMRAIGAMGHKGGVGKTVALMALASVYAAEGKRVALLDADANTPFSRWRDKGEATGFWSDAVTIGDVIGDDDLERALGAAEAEGYDVALVDTRGGNSAFNEISACMVDAVIVPTRCAQLDADAAFQTVRLLARIGAGGDYVAPHRLLLQMHRGAKATATESAFEAALRRETPCLDTVLGERAAFRDLPTLGLLGPILDHVRENERFRARQFEPAWREAKALAAEVWRLAAPADADGQGTDAAETGAPLPEMAR